MTVAVVGGGFSGLFTACELIAAGIEDVVVLERSTRPGGVAVTITRNGFALEPAVGSMTLPHPHLSPLLRRVGAEISAPASASIRHIYTGGRLVEVRPSPAAMFAPLLPWPSRLRALLEMFVHSQNADEEETLSQFCRRRFGSEAGHLLAWLMASGVFAGDPVRLSAQAAFPALTALEKAHGSVLKGMLRRRRRRPAAGSRPGVHHPIGGMSRLAEQIIDLLGERYRGEFAVSSVASQSRGWVVHGPETLHVEAVVVAAAPADAAKLLDDELADHLSGAETAPVAVVGLGGDEGVLPPGFGALVGPEEGLASLGFVFESSYAPERAPRGSWLIKAVVGGATRRAVLGEDDLAEIVGEEAEQVLGMSLNPVFVEVVRHVPGIPQYHVGHTQWLERLDRLLAERPGLHLTGWGYRGVGLGNVATDAVRVARRLVQPVP